MLAKTPSTLQTRRAQIREKEIKACAENGVTDIIEVQIGYDGIVFASDINGDAFEFTPDDWYKALAAKLVVDGELVDNPNRPGPM